MRRNINIMQYNYNTKLRKLVIETPYYFETLIILKLWQYVKTTKSVDFENYIYKVVITGTININHKHQDFMPPAWISMDLLNVLDFLEQDLAVIYKTNCNSWLERYSETFSCFSDFQISIEICDIDFDEKSGLMRSSVITHGIPYFYFYWSNLSQYTKTISLRFGRVVEFMWGQIVIFLTRFSFPRFLCFLFANFFLTLLLLFHYISKFFLFFFSFLFKLFSLRIKN